MTRRETRGLAIDFDGVIVDSQPMHYRAWQEVIRQMNLKVPLTPQALLGLSVAALVGAWHLPGDLAARAAQLKQELVIAQSRTAPPPLYPGVKTALHELSQKYRLALVSSVEKMVAINALQHHLLYDLFKVLVLEGDYHKPKPHPEPYQVCLARLNLSAHQVIAIEDSAIGVESAKAAGLIVIALTHTSAEAELHQADYIVARFDQITALLENT